jgi:UDP-N-acetyl-D-mannosaminuronic acid transferase (WecB/TagA/CpsF family)
MRRSESLTVSVPAGPMPSEAVLGIPLAVTEHERTLDWVDATVASRGRRYICAAAVHTVMASLQDPELRAGVHGGDFAVPDGRGGHAVDAIRVVVGHIEAAVGPHRAVHGPTDHAVAVAPAARDR